MLTAIKIYYSNVLPQSFFEGHAKIQYLLLVIRSTIYMRYVFSIEGLQVYAVLWMGGEVRCLMQIRIRLPA